MTPLRLLIIGLLLYVLYRLLIGSSRKKVRSNKRADAAGEKIQDVLVEDPVCHTYIPKGQAVQLHHNKQVLYFCSNKCCEKFLEQKGADK